METSLLIIEIQLSSPVDFYPSAQNGSHHSQYRQDRDLLTESDHVGVAPVGADEHPVGVDGEVEGGEALLVELDQLHDLHLARLHVQQVERVVPAHRQQLALVHHPHQALHLAAEILDIRYSILNEWSIKSSG